MLIREIAHVEPLSWPATCRLRAERILVCGGRNFEGPLADAYVYDVTAGIWEKVTAMATPRMGHAVVALDEDHALAIGGAVGESNALAELWNGSCWSPIPI